MKNEGRNNSRYYIAYQLITNARAERAQAVEKLRGGKK
jgi:hypothetical protein